MLSVDQCIYGILWGPENLHLFTGETGPIWASVGTPSPPPGADSRRAAGRVEGETPAGTSKDLILPTALDMFS